MRDRGIDILLAGGYVNFGYLTDFFTHFGRDFPGPLYNGLPLVRFAGLPAEPHTPPFLISCPDEAEDARVQGTWIADCQFPGPASELPGPGLVPNTEQEPYAALTRSLRERGLDRSVIGIDLVDLPALTAERLRAALPQAQLVDASSDFGFIRMVKTEGELARLRGAVAGSERGHAAVAANLQAGMTERDLAAITKRAVTDADTNSYILHLSAGAPTDTLLPPTNRLIESNSVVSADIGCIHRNYIGDKFHTYALGRPDERAYDIHARLDQVNEALLTAVRPGVSGAEFFAFGRAQMESRGLQLAGAFIGHGIGIDVHETPYLAPIDPTPLQPGMVIILEAGTRSESIGFFCSEIACLVEADGCQVLTQIGHSITQVG